MNWESSLGRVSDSVRREDKVPVWRSISSVAAHLSARLGLVSRGVFIYQRHLLIPEDTSHTELTPGVDVHKDSGVLTIFRARAEGGGSWGGQAPDKDFYPTHDLLDPKRFGSSSDPLNEHATIEARCIPAHLQFRNLKASSLDIIPELALHASKHDIWISIFQRCRYQPVREVGWHVAPKYGQGMGTDASMRYEERGRWRCGW